MENSQENLDPNHITFGGHLKLRRIKIHSGVTINLVLVVVWVIAIAVAITHFATRKEPDEERTMKIVADIQPGVVWGRQEGGAFVFKGIPYAKPATGERRWKPPIPCGKNTCWSDPFDAGEFGNICAQQDLLNTTGDPKNVTGSEDCLFINVWTPKERPNGQLLPVLVFIHGGFLLYLSGNWKGIHPSPEMVVNMSIVGVSFNYRLNAFGFLALESLADASPSKPSGNYGFMDQILALKWVKANIKKFGGDPDSVTLMGSSSGGTSGLALLASRKATGLFHRAILMSASAIFNKSSENAALDNKIFVKNSNCDKQSFIAKRKCLYELTPREIQDAIPWEEFPNWRMDDLLDLPTYGHFAGAIAVVDKEVVPEPPLVAMTTGKANDVPLIIGTTAQESDIAPPKVFKNSNFAVNFTDYVNKTLGSFPDVNVSQILKLYEMTNDTDFFGSFEHSIQFKFTSMVSDIRATCPNNIVATKASRGLESPVYRYVVTNRPFSAVNLFGFNATFAFHMWDLVAFFGFPSEIGYQPSPKDKEFMNDLRREFGEFMKEGKVKTESWKEYPNKTALFNDTGVVVPENEYHKVQCDFWFNNSFFSYAWIN